MEAGARKGREVPKLFFQCFVAPEGRKLGSLKRRARRHLGRWEMKNCTPSRREAHSEVNMYKTPQLWTTFGSWDVQKVHAVVARTTFGSKKCQSTSLSEHFWKLGCQKSARRFGAKQILKRTCTKDLGFGPLFDGSMAIRCRKKCTPLWREAHLKVKCLKNWGYWATFDVSDVVLFTARRT